MFASIRRWLLPPVFDGDEDKTRVAAVLNGILWVFVIAATLYGMLAPIAPEMRSRRFIIIVPFVVVMLVLKQMMNWGHVRLTGNIVVFCLWFLLTGAMLFGADHHNPAFMGYLIVVICAGLILSWRAAIAWSLFSILTNAVILQLGQAGVLPLSDSAPPLFAFWAAQTVYILTATFLLSQTLRKLDHALANVQRELKERKRMETEREQIIRELETKNAELERFTYTVSHDLKSPLITIGGFIGLLEEDARSGDTVKFEKDLNRIREAKDQMYRLLNELLELSRIGRVMNPPTEVAFSQIIEEALAATHGRLLAGNVQVEILQDLPVVRGDHPRLVEVMQNLIDNSAKFMGEQPNPQIEIGIQAEGGRTIFFVKDNGIGIDVAFHHKIFGLFDKLNPQMEGTGVGLTLVKRIIELHGGHIWVESEGKGKGSTFYFTLPVVTEEP